MVATASLLAAPRAAGPGTDVSVRFALGAAAALILTGIVLWVRARVRPRRPRLTDGPPSRTATVAASGSATIALTLVALIGGFVASVTLPVLPGEDPAVTPSTHVFVPMVLVLFVVPVLAVLAVLFGDAAEHPPRGVGALPVGLVHAVIAAFLLGFGRLATSARAELLCYGLAVAPAVAAVAYVVMFVDYLRTPMSRRP